MKNRIDNFIENSEVILTAGGEGSRFRNVPGSTGLQKAAYVLPNGQTMIERTVTLYRDAGFKNFVILLYHNAESVQDLLQDGGALGVKIRYSLDPGRPVGRGGALKNAFVNGSIQKGKYLIVHNPDDQLVKDAKNLVLGAVEAHLDFESKGALATAVMTPGTKYDFTGFEVKEGFVTGAEMYPFIKMPTHIGLTIFSPKINKYFDKLFDLSKKNDFEAVLFPVLTKENKLAAHFIPLDAWVSVNDEKGLKKLVAVLESENDNSS